MPGAGLQMITQAAKNEIRSLNHKDCIIIWGGSYDINENESSTGLKHIRNFTLQNQHTNIIIIPALHRHDLTNSSCVNYEIQVFNRKLSKMTKVMSHVELLDLAMDKNDFTRHGMHLNLSGKEKVVLLIGQHLINLLAEQVNNILPLSWIHDSKDLNSTKEDDVAADTMLLERFLNKVRASERPKKPPVTRTNDIFQHPALLKDSLINRKSSLPSFVQQFFYCFYFVRWSHIHYMFWLHRAIIRCTSLSNLVTLHSFWQLFWLRH
jgi:hypothetical protein